MNSIVSALQSKNAKFFPFIPVVNILYVVGVFLCSQIPLWFYAIALPAAGLAGAAARYVLPPVLAAWYIVPVVMGLMLYFKGKRHAYVEHPPKKRLISAVVLLIACVVILPVYTVISQFSTMLHPPLQDKTVQMTQALLDQDESTWFDMLHMRRDSSISELKGVLGTLKKNGIQLKGDIAETRLVSFSEESRGLRNTVTDAVFRIKIGETLYLVTVQYVKNNMGEGFTKYQIDPAE